MHKNPPPPPLGNKRAVGNKGNRDNPNVVKYKPEYCEELIKFFDVPYYESVDVVDKKTGNLVKAKAMAGNLPWFSAFARKIGVDENAFIYWKKRYPDFRTAYSRAKRMQQEMINNLALRGGYNPYFAVFCAKNMFGWTDKMDVNKKVTAKVENEVKINFTNKADEVKHKQELDKIKLKYEKELEAKFKK